MQANGMTKQQQLTALEWIRLMKALNYWECESQQVQARLFDTLTRLAS